MDSARCRLETDGERLVDSLVAQAKDIIKAAYQPLVEATQCKFSERTQILNAQEQTSPSAALTRFANDPKRTDHFGLGSV